MSAVLDEKLKNLPVSPGVYLHKDEAGKILYVGKAKNLRNRVRSYFQSGRGHDRKTRELVRRIRDLEFIVTDNEVEALVLESNLIKQHKPRYNILLKDDKQYPHLKLTVNEPFPRVMITRRIQRDGALYFGPFLPASLARRTIDLINRTFQLRTCDIEIDGRLPRPCLEYHIKRCLGPCVKGLCTPDEYTEAVQGRAPAPGREEQGAGRHARSAHDAGVRRDALRDGGEVPRPAQDRDGDCRAAEDGDLAGARRGHLRLLPRGRAPRPATLHHARGQDRRPPRVLLGGLAGRGLRRVGVFERRDDAVLLDRLRAARDSRAGGFRGPRAAGKGSERAARAARPHPGPEARREARSD